jgi:hypothetical protein
VYRLVDKPCCHRRTVTADASDKAKIGIIIPKLYSRMSRLVYFCILLIWSFAAPKARECNPMRFMWMPQALLLYLGKDVDHRLHLPLLG